MPRIVPLQLLKCLKVLLDDNGGILSESEVKRIAGLMTKYSKKLVSKCIYVQILKCTKTELLGEFMGAGGWTLVHMWLNDAIRAMNWPLVQEILELLLLCPVDVDRLKSNSAPKLVRGLCKDGGIEGVRILAKRLVEQWLKVVTADSNVVSSSTAQKTATAVNTQQTPAPLTTTSTMPPQSVTMQTPPITAEIASTDTIPATAASNTKTTASVPATKTAVAATKITPATSTPKITASAPATKNTASPPATKITASAKVVPAATTKAAATPTKTNKPAPKSKQRITAAAIQRKKRFESYSSSESEEERDPLADVPNDVPLVPTYGLTPAQKKASEAGLVYKIMVKDGQQVLTKVDTAADPKEKNQTKSKQKPESVEMVDDDEEEQEEEEEEEVESIEAEEEDETAQTQDHIEAPNDQVDAQVVNETAEECVEKPEKDTAVESSEEEITPDVDKKTKENNKYETKVVTEEVKSEEVKDKDEKQLERKNSKDLKDSVKEKEKEKERKSEKEKERKSSSVSSSHKSSSSSSSHKSSSKSSSSSSSKSKSSSSTSSSSHRSSSDKHRRSSSDKDKEKEKDKERSSTSSSSKEKDRSSSSSKHKSSSSSSSKLSSSSSSSKLNSSISSSSSSKERHRDKDKEKEKEKDKSSSVISKKEKETTQAEKDKETLANVTKQPSLDKLGKIPKKLKELVDSEDSNSSGVTKAAPTSITIPSKKASMSIEIRRDSEKTKTVKTYKSQFRSHGLTEEAPPPPSRKGLKKPSSASTPGTAIPLSLPSSMKRASPPPSRDSPSESKKPKIDMNNVSNVGTEKPGAIKLIAPKKIQTLVETNIFSDALIAATGPKKTAKRKRSTSGKDGPVSPTTPEAAPKVAPLKFYQDTLDESKEDDKTSSAERKLEDNSKDNSKDETTTDKENSNIEDDDDIPLKKVKEDIEQKVLKEQKANAVANPDVIEIASDDNNDVENLKSKTDDAADDTAAEYTPEPKQPGPGCGPNGPPGVLMLHRRKGPKKKLTWRSEEQLEQIRYFELDETERVNVTKTFMDMKNMERFSERDAINMSRRGFNHEDNMLPQTPWKALLMMDDVPPHPDGNQSKERKVQTDREQTTLRALYFSHSMIPDTPTEAELEPHYPHDIPVIPLEDITGNPDAVNDFTSMPWPEPKGSPKPGDSALAGTGGLSSPGDMFGAGTNAFNPFMMPFPPGSGVPQQNHQQLPSAPAMPAAHAVGMWSGPNGPMHNGNMVGNMMPSQIGGHPFAAPMQMPTSPPVMEMGPMGGPGNQPPANYMGGRNPFGGPGGQNQYGPQYGPGPGFNGPNFGPNMGPHGQMMNGGVPPSLMNGPPRNSGNNNRGGNNGNWRSGGSNFSDNNNSGGGGNWRPAGSGQNRNDWTGGGGGGGGSSNVCKAFMRGHCRLGKSCKFMHPKSKRI